MHQKLILKQETKGKTSSGGKRINNGIFHYLSPGVVFQKPLLQTIKIPRKSSCLQRAILRTLDSYWFWTLYLAWKPHFSDL